MLFYFSAVLRAQKLEFLLVLRYKIVWVKWSTLQLYYLLAIFTLPWYLRLVLSHAYSANTLIGVLLKKGYWTVAIFVHNSLRRSGLA